MMEALLSIIIAIKLCLFALILICVIDGLNDMWMDYFSVTPKDIFEKFVRKILSVITGKNPKSDSRKYEFLRNVRAWTFIPME